MLENFMTPQERAEERERFGRFMDFNWLSDSPDAVARRLEFAETVYDRVLDWLDHTNPIPYLMEVTRGSAGVKKVLHEVKGGKVYPWGPGAFLKRSKFQEVEHTITTAFYQITIAFDSHDLKIGRYLPSDVVKAATERILAQKISIAWNALKTGIPSSDTTNYTSFTTNIGQAALNAGIHKINDLDECDLIVGRHTKLTPVSGFDGYGTAVLSDKMIDDLARVGIRETYLGCKVLPLKKFYDEAYATNEIDDDNIWLVPAGKNWAEYHEEIPIETDNWIDHDTKEVVFSYTFKDGAALYKAGYYHRFEDTA